MRKLTLLLCLLATAFVTISGQSVLNSSADSILGEYEVRHQGEYTKVRVTKDTDGTYKAQVFWVEDRLDKNGNVRLDEKNPDRSLREVPCNQIVLMTGLKYDSKKQRWGDTKLYDPTRGVRANVTCEFREEKGLRVRISFLCFAQT